MREQLARWLEADKKLYDLKASIKSIEDEVELVQREIEDVKLEIKSEMDNGGVLEDLIEGEFVNYKIYFTTSKGSVKVPDASAVPDEFCDIIRKPKLREIKDYIDENKVNWATIEFNEPKLSYKVIKKQ